MAIDFNALKAEVQNDPLALGYAAPLAAGNDVQLVLLLNNSFPGDAAHQQNAGVIPAYKVINATVPAEWAALTANEKQRYQTFTGAGQVDTADPNTQAAFLAMFAAGTATRANLTALAKRAGSRAEKLFGAGTVVQVGDVSFALRGVR